MNNAEVEERAIASMLFDGTWYVQQHPEVAADGDDPLGHYLAVGAHRGFDPHPLFDTTYYLSLYPDVVRSNVNPLVHFLRHGAAEGRRPHALFDTAWYKARYKDFLSDNVNPLIDYLTVGAARGREPNPSFDTRAYLECHPHVKAQGLNPLVHFITCSGEPKSDRPRIQVHRRGGVGDVLLITPVLRALRQQYPNDEIVVSTLYGEVLLHNPHVDKVLHFGAPEVGFDRTFDLTYELWPDKHIVDAYADIAGITITDRTPELYLHHDERMEAQELLMQAGLRRDMSFVAMQLTSGWHVRDWPLERFSKVAAALERDGFSTVVLGENALPPIDFGLDLRGKTSLRLAAAIIEKCALMISIDSALMHVAYAFRRPVISLFGCTDPEKRVPDWARPTAIFSDMVCRGCHHRQRPIPATQAPSCPWESVRCMDRLVSNTILMAARAELDKWSTPKVSIIIPHYFKYDLLHACIESILRVASEYTFEVIVVANGSPESSLRAARAWEPRIRIVHLEKNQGFSRACNAGAMAARGEYVVFLNDDTTVTAGWLDALVDHIESDPMIGVVGPKLLYPDTEGIQHCGTVFNEKGLGEHIYRYLPTNFAAANRPRFYRALTGACLLLKRRLFIDLGSFDSDFHGTGGCEDTDLCFKILSVGRMVAYCPTSVVYHHEGLTRGLRDETHHEDVFNRQLLAQRWPQYLSADIGEYSLLDAIETAEGQIWPWLRQVPAEILARYDEPRRREPMRAPFKIEIDHDNASARTPGFLRLGSCAGAAVDIVHDLARPLPLMAASVDELRIIHIMERFPWREISKFLNECFRVLTLGGRLIIRTRDFSQIVRDYVAASVSLTAGGTVSLSELQQESPGIRFSDTVFGASPQQLQVHSCLDFESLIALCRIAGFQRITHETRASDTISSRDIEIGMFK